VLAAVHEVLSHALYQHTHLFYSRHLDTLLLASLYGYCKVNRLHQVCCIQRVLRSVKHVSCVWLTTCGAGKPLRLLQGQPAAPGMMHSKGPTVCQAC
jgi:hypothetical protein